MPFIPTPDPEPIEISKYLGVNEAIGQTEIVTGELIELVNFRITPNLKPEKRPGHKTFIDYENVKNIQGMWQGTIAGKTVLISCNNGKAYEYDFAEETNTEIGTLTDAKTSIFYFESKLYFLNGTDYKEYDGTTFQDVDPYIPTLFIGTEPAGGGTALEPINLLTGKKKQEFVGDGTATEYQLAESGLDEDLVTCTIDGVTKAEITDFTVNRTTGIVTFTAAPADESEVILGWTKVESGNADLVKKNRFALINGPGNDTAVFLWGNPDQKNRRTWSGTLKANYFPVFNYTYIGSDEYAITDIAETSDRQLIFKQDKTHYSYPEWSSTAKAWDYPVFDLSDKVGNVVFGQVQVVNNFPLCLKDQSWWYWHNTAVKDERGADAISERLRQSFSAIDLTTAVTFDNQKEKEYWCNVGSKVYIWNYGNNTMYMYDNISATRFLDIGGVIYYGSHGTIERFEGLNDNGVAINAYGILGFEDWGSFELEKNTDRIFVGLLPDSQTSITFYYRTNRITEFKPVKKIEYRLLDFNAIDFNNFSFLTNRNPQPFARRIRADKYSYIQFKFENKELNETCTLLALKVNAEIQGEV